MLEGFATAPAAQLIVELHFWGKECLDRVNRWHAQPRRCSQAVNKLAPCTTWRRACLGAPPSPNEAAAFAATLRGLRNTGYDVSLVSANGFSNVFLNFSLPGSRRDVEDFDVLCCYEAVFVRGGV